MTVFDILARRNADKLRAIRADGASVRYHLRMDDGTAGVIDAFELFDGVSLAFNSIPPVSYTHLDVYKRQPLGYRQTQQGSSYAWRA